jgi:hypothetical protein
MKNYYNSVDIDFNNFGHTRNKYIIKKRYNTRVC